MKERLRLYLWLAKVNLIISTFTFGGGYVVVPMVQKYFVERKKFFTDDELMEMAAIAQSTPGAIAVNMVALAGYRVAKKAGLFISCVCAVIPPILILSVISVCYTAVISNPAVTAVLKGMQAGAAALIVDFVVDMVQMIRKEKSVVLNLMIILSFAASFFTDINVILILLCSCGVCILWVWIKKRGGDSECRQS